jgi:phosphonate transport system substrate-binding protein
MIRGYGGRKVDGYDVNFPEAQFSVPSKMMETIDDAMKGEILKKASQP